MQCCALHMELEQPWYHTTVVSVAEQYWHRIRTPSNLPRDSRLGVGKKWGRNTTRAADLNQPKGYSIPYDVTLSNKRWKKIRREDGWALVKTSVLPINGYVCWGPASRTWSSIARLWEVESNFFPLHCHTAFACCFVGVFFFSLFPLPFFPFS